jgi:hypothetical protein
MMKENSLFTTFRTWAAHHEKNKKPVNDFERKTLTAPTSFIFRNCVVNLRIIYQQTTLRVQENGEEGEGEYEEEAFATNAEEKGTG